jgi:hypothetical protein
MNGTNYLVPHCGAFSTTHSHSSWAQIFASESWFQIPYSTTVNTIVLYILIFKFLERSRGDKSVWTEYNLSWTLILKYKNYSYLKIVSYNFFSKSTNRIIKIYFALKLSIWLQKASSSLVVIFARTSMSLCTMTISR